MHLDRRTDVSFGRRTTDWELKGIPVRIEIGPRDLEQGEVTVVRRDRREKSQVAQANAAVSVQALLGEIQSDMLADAEHNQNARTVSVTNVDDALEAIADGFVQIPWSTLGIDGERRLMEASGSVRCLVREDGSLPTGDDGEELVAIVARSY